MKIIQWSSGLHHCIALQVYTKVSEQCMASINFNSEAEGIIFLHNTSAHLQVYMMS